jgi:hypothetical protein
MDSLAALALALVICGCGRSPLDDPESADDATDGLGGSGAAGAWVPAQHRASSICAPVDLSGPCFADCRGKGLQAPGPDGCQTDGDCTNGVHGRCVAVDVSRSFCGCVYDRCGSDADCGTGQACACNSVGFGNMCVPGSCAVDADCGPGGFCGPVVNPCSPAIVEYQCHSSRDQCASSSDCPPTDDCLAYPGEGWACRLPAVCRG